MVGTLLEVHPENKENVSLYARVRKRYATITASRLDLNRSSIARPPVDALFISLYQIESKVFRGNRFLEISNEISIRRKSKTRIAVANPEFLDD